MVLFEAMATRTPIVATAVGGVPDVLPDGTAVLVPAERPAALAQAVANTFRDPVQSMQRALRARERLDAVYGVKPWVAAYERVYNQARSVAADALS